MKLLEKVMLKSASQILYNAVFESHKHCFTHLPYSFVRKALIFYD